MTLNKEMGQNQVLLLIVLKHNIYMKTKVKQVIKTLFTCIFMV